MILLIVRLSPLFIQRSHLKVNTHNYVLYITVEMSGSEPILPLMDRRAVEEEAESLETLRAAFIAAVGLS